MAPELGLCACFGLIHFQHRVDTEWDSPSTELTQCENPHQLSQHVVKLHFNWVNTEGVNIYEDFIIPRWLSWCWVSHCDSVDGESHLALTQLMGNETLCQLSHLQTLKNLNKSANLRTKSKKLKSLIIWHTSLYVWSVQKTRTKNLMQVNGYGVPYGMYLYFQPMQVFRRILINKGCIQYILIVSPLYGWKVIWLRHGTRS